jgi:hypothetical protein
MTVEVTQIVARRVAAVPSKLDSGTLPLGPMGASRKASGELLRAQSERAGFGACQFLT